MPPTDETSRPARRRVLGRGPGAPAAPAPVAPDEAPADADAPDGAGAPAARTASPSAPAPEAAEAATMAGPPAPVTAPAPDSGPSAASGAVRGAEHVPPVASGAAGAPEAAPPAAADAPPAGDATGSAPDPGTAGATAPRDALRPEAAPEPGAVPAHAGVPAPEAAPVPDVAPVPGAASASEAAHGAASGAEGDGRFTVRLANFEGPFDLLLQLIAKHKMDVTEVALSKVTDEFMAHIRSMGADWDLDQTTEFLVVAATLLDLKAARLLPAAEVEDEADLALLEARDLLFARLLQYRAYKQIAEIFERRLDDESRRFPRTVGLEPHHAELLPDVVISIGAEGFARLAVKAMQPKPKPQVYVDHIHAPLVSVREQAEVVVALLRERGTASFRELTEGVDDTLTVVARFLALLELYREKALVLDQPEALGELTVTWAAGDGAGEVTVTDEFDQVVEEKE